MTCMCDQSSDVVSKNWMLAAIWAGRVKVENYGSCFFAWCEYLRQFGEQEKRLLSWASQIQFQINFVSSDYWTKCCEIILCY